ncbi:Spy/CpxP family protein refolding chaperone [Bdellovibrio sp. 22V]|uniref:Spy/CpxP family protein refolding chaperone n=1 Tax=Bdellovibrio TaxID=958 RepID=UPI002543ED56|nr:Spy/CpxP family protein refolding chaperone [Bdellovibrio sp. 22V]WII70847.1 Spy/CpxP family protein refolding chaperone [Bdellovibrio sp. 22V]
MRHHHHSHHHRKWPKVLGILLAIGSVGFLSGCHKSPEERISAISEKIADKLDFNEQQKALLGDITSEMKKDFAEEKNVRKGMKDTVKGLILADDLDKSRIKELIKARQARFDAKVDKYLDKVAALHKTLTPEQKKEMIDKIEKFHARWE